MVASAKDDEDESSDHLGAPLQDEQTTASNTQPLPSHPPSVSKATPFADVKATVPAPTAPSS